MIVHILQTILHRTEDDRLIATDNKCRILSWVFSHTENTIDSLITIRIDSCHLHVYIITDATNKWNSVVATNWCGFASNTQITITITYKIGQRSLICKCKYTHKVGPYLRLTLMVKFYLHQNMLHPLNTHRRYFSYWYLFTFRLNFKGNTFSFSLWCWFSLNETISRQTER